MHDDEITEKDLRDAEQRQRSLDEQISQHSSAPALARLSNIVLRLANGRLEELKVNGTDLIVCDVLLELPMDGMPVLKVDLPVLDAEIAGAVGVVIRNSLPGSRIAIDERGMTWLEPAPSNPADGETT